MTRTENGETITYTLGVGDRLASWTGGSYEYDTAGCATQIIRAGKPTLDLTWNSLYQLVSVSTNGVFAESYTYDALDCRVSTTTLEGTTRHVYDDDWQCIADMDEQGNVVASYVWGDGIDKLLAVKIGDDTYYPLTDVQGTVWGYVDSSNNIVARRQYDAWGNVVDESVSVPALAKLRYCFQGREWSATTGLINFRMRWYDSETGRWLSKDPIGISGGLNLYVFCGNDAINGNDPYGEFFFAPILVIPIARIVASSALVVAIAIVKDAVINVALPAVEKLVKHCARELIDTASYFNPKGGHSKNARPSTKEKHEKGDARRIKDQRRSKNLNGGRNRTIPIPIDSVEVESEPSGDYKCDD